MCLYLHIFGVSGSCWVARESPVMWDQLHKQVELWTLVCVLLYFHFSHSSSSTMQTPQVLYWLLWYSSLLTQCQWLLYHSTQRPSTLIDAWTSVRTYSQFNTSVLQGQYDKTIHVVGLGYWCMHRYTLSSLLWWEHLGSHSSQPCITDTDCCQAAKLQWGFRDHLHDKVPGCTPGFKGHLHDKSPV